MPTIHYRTNLDLAKKYVSNILMDNDSRIPNIGERIIFQVTSEKLFELEVVSIRNIINCEGNRYQFNRVEIELNVPKYFYSIMEWEVYFNNRIGR